MKALPRRILREILIVYLVTTGFWVGFYNWRQVSAPVALIDGLYSGSLSRVEGLAWPYFFHHKVFASPDSWLPSDRANAKHFTAAMEAKQRATQIGNAGAPFTTLTPADTEQMVVNMRDALQQAELVENRVLTKAHPTLRWDFRRQFQRGIELRLQNLEKRGDTFAELKGSALLDSWTDWFNAHRDDLRIPVEP